MTPEQFWDNDPALMWSYRISYIKQQKIQNSRDNQLAYFQGIYNCSAFNTVINSAFGKKVEYMEMLDLDKIEKDSKMTEEEKKKESKKILEQQLKAELMKTMNILKKESE